MNSEHEKNIPNDSWRLDQLEKSTAKKDHAFNKFGTGKLNISFQSFQTTAVVEG